jgi:hypothetical protein
MKEAIGHRVGVFRTTIRPAVLLALSGLTLVTPLVAILTKTPFDTSNMTALLFVYAATCCLVWACMWLATFWFWKVTLFEGGILGTTYSLGFRTLAWGEIISAERIPLAVRFHTALRLQPSRGPAIVITVPLVGMQEFKEHVRRLAGDDHPFTRLLHER